MKTILVLGAGQSAPYLIRRLLEEPIRVVVADRELAAAERAVAGSDNGTARSIDATDTQQLVASIRDADMVVNLLAPMFQAPVARLCLELGRSMVSASYRSPELAALDGDARDAGLVFASEMGLDPGLDHMSAMRLLAELRGQGVRIDAFDSYGAGLADPETVKNPLGYAITWNPRNVVMAGEAGARYLGGNQVRLVPYPTVFERTWPVDVPGVGSLEAYANRDSVGYIPLYGLETAHRVMRATMRAPGFCETWHAVARLGLANEKVEVPGLPEMSWKALVETFLPETSTGDVLARVCGRLGVHPGSRAASNLRWLGMFSEDTIRDLSPAAAAATTPAQAMIALLAERLALPEGGRDLVVLHHEIAGTDADGRSVKATSTLACKGEPGGITGMARTVGLPAALAALDILEGSFPVLGCPLPTEVAIYERLLPRVEASGLRFEERIERL